jgi:tripartite-type tricarboxylate transporter receptor subunit TctC
LRRSGTAWRSAGGHNARIEGTVLALFGIAYGASAVQAETVERFYHNNTITISIGLEEGGGYDLLGRLIGRYIGQYIPGNPQVIVDNQTGAGGMVLANSLYNVDKQDGATLGVLNETVALSQQIGDGGVKYDASRFNWIGRMASGAETVVIAARTGVRTIDDAKKKQVAVGATGKSGTSALFPMVLNSLLATEFKIVLGYPGMSSTWVAMDRGEIDGGSNSLASIKSTKPDWLRNNSMNFLVQVGLTRDPALPDTPLLSEVGVTQFDTQVLQLFSTPAEIGRALVAPPGVPAERLAALRIAFDSALHDPRLVAEAKKMHIDIEPLAGDELQKIVASSISAPDAVVARAKQAINQ